LEKIKPAKGDRRIYQILSHREPIAAKPQPKFLATEGTEDTEVFSKSCMNPKELRGVSLAYVSFKNIYSKKTLPASKERITLFQLFQYNYILLAKVLWPTFLSRKVG